MDRLPGANIEGVEAMFGLARPMSVNDFRVGPVLMSDFVMFLALGSTYSATNVLVIAMPEGCIGEASWASELDCGHSADSICDLSVAVRCRLVCLGLLGRSFCTIVVVLCLVRVRGSVIMIVLGDASDVRHFEFSSREVFVDADVDVL